MRALCAIGTRKGLARIGEGAVLSGGPTAVDGLPMSVIRRAVVIGNAGERSLSGHLRPGEKRCPHDSRENSNGGGNVLPQPGMIFVRCLPPPGLVLHVARLPSYAYGVRCGVAPRAVPAGRPRLPGRTRRRSRASARRNQCATKARENLPHWWRGIRRYNVPAAANAIAWRICGPTTAAAPS
jgi:hypothetical protein